MQHWTTVTGYSRTLHSCNRMVPMSITARGGAAYWHSIHRSTPALMLQGKKPHSRPYTVAPSPCTVNLALGASSYAALITTSTEETWTTILLCCLACPCWLRLSHAQCRCSLKEQLKVCCAMASSCSLAAATCQVPCHLPMSAQFDILGALGHAQIVVYQLYR